MSTNSWHRVTTALSRNSTYSLAVWTDDLKWTSKRQVTLTLLSHLVIRM